LEFVIGKRELIAEDVGGTSFEPAASVTQPHDDAIAVKQIGPDEISSAVIVKISSEKRSVIRPSDAEVKRDSLAGPAQSNAD